MKDLYIIAGPNGAGKTTASYTILPEIFNCEEFVNADEIAKGLSPFNPDTVAIQSGRMMLERINYLLLNDISFAIETTLSTKRYTSLIKKAKIKGYAITLLFLSLDSVELAISRVVMRVKEGGHNIPKDVIERRFTKGLKNFFNLYVPIVDRWLLINNSEKEFITIARGSINGILFVENKSIWNQLKKMYHDN